MKKMMMFLAGLCLVALAGCNYRVGSVMHPQIKTVAIAPVINETIYYALATDLRGLLSERFMFDGSLKVVSEKEADCIVYARVLDAKFKEITWSSQNSDDLMLPNQWRVELTVEYSVILPGRGTPLAGPGRVKGMAEFQTGPDMETGRLSGIRQAGYDAAKMIVASTVEAW